MAKKSTIKVSGVRAGSIAMFEGTFAAIIGLAIAVLFSLNKTVEMADATDSVLAGLAFGVGAGIVSILVLPLIYFGIGWVIGYIHGWVFNAVAGSSGGIDLHVEE